MSIIKIFFVLVIGASMFSVGSLSAKDKNNQKSAVPPPPPMSKKSTKRRLVGARKPKPVVRTVPKKGMTHEEYRINDQLYMIKIIPDKGSPYYLYDPNGEGQFSRKDLGSEVTTPAWVITTF